MLSNKLPKVQKPQLGRRFAPMQGAIRKRTTGNKAIFQLQNSEELPESSKSHQKLSTPGKSREGTRQKPATQSKTQLISQKVTPQTACIQTLQQGFAQSYIDLFYLTHGKFEEISVKKQALLSLKEKLIQAEQFMQEQDFSSSFQMYHELGGHFENQEKFDAATYFYTRSVEIASKRELFVQLSTGYQGLGNCAYKTKQIELAIQMYQKGVGIADTHLLRHSLITISKHLVEVYMLQADKLEDEERLDDALQIHLKCLESAKNAQDLIAQGNSCYRIGLIYFEQQEYFQALEYFQKYLSLSRTVDYVDGISNALAKIAATHQAMDNIKAAINNLEQLHQEAEDNNKLAAEAQASLHLGLLHQQQDQPKLAVEFLDKHFILAQKLQDREMVDTARINLGMAKANCSVEEYTELIAGDIQNLIKWKTERKKFQQNK